LESVGININVPCGGKGICGKCKILINKGITTATPIEEELLSGEEIKKGFRIIRNASFIHNKRYYCAFIFYDSR